MERTKWQILSDIISDDSLRGEERLRKVIQEFGGQQIRIPPLYYEERDRKIRELKAMGKTITTIAKEFNLSTERV